MTMNVDNLCQSCGYPLNRDEHGGGTERDGSRSVKYCSMCYAGGVFLTPPEIDTAPKMQRYCMQQMKRAGYSTIRAWLATRSIARLERWKGT
jgi:hypothetical protein